MMTLKAFSKMAAKLILSYDKGFDWASLKFIKIFSHYRYSQISLD